jgi:hypothetical protein
VLIAFIVDGSRFDFERAAGVKPALSRSMPGGVRLGPVLCHNWYRTVNKEIFSLFLELVPGFRRNLRGHLCHHSQGMKQRKGQMIKARVSSKMKRDINDLADQRGESEAVIIREALSQYLRKSTILLGSSPSYRPKKRN